MWKKAAHRVICGKSCNYFQWRFWDFSYTWSLKSGHITYFPIHSFGFSFSHREEANSPFRVSRTLPKPFIFPSFFCSQCVCLYHSSTAPSMSPLS